MKLGKYYDELISRLLNSGKYMTKAEVMREALALLEERELENARIMLLLSEQLQEKDGQPKAS